MNLAKEKKKIKNFMKGRLGRQAETKIVQDIEELRTYESNQKSILTNEDSMTCYECQTEIKNKKLAMHLRETTFFAGKPVLKKRCFWTDVNKVDTKIDTI